MTMKSEPQVTDTVFMVRPARFFSNPQTRSSNAFQGGESGVSGVEAKALTEFDDMVNILRSAGIRVLLAQDSPEPSTPDSIFPNNWISFHREGKAFIYPMCAPNRREERMKGLEKVLQTAGYHWSTIDLSSYEEGGHFLEGTGSMVLDRTNKVAYACRSPRTDEATFHDFCKKSGYRGIIFDAWHETGGNSFRVYHTNVLMCIGEHLAIICSESITNEMERNDVLTALQSTGREIIQISPGQMDQFAGNMLELRSLQGEALMVMSLQARQSLLPVQLEYISKYCRILAPDITTIETHGGGSARCMLAEVFLPSPEQG